MVLETASVGVVGLGAMGRPIAGLLAHAGHPTYGYDVDVSVVADAGVRPAESVVDLAARSDVVLVMVPSDRDVLDVCLADDGLLAGARAGTVLLICGSVTPGTCRRVAERARAVGVDVLDAALTGGVRAAEAGQVNLLVGGDESVVDRVRPTLACWTSSVHHLGAIGAGQVGKTVNNLCHWGQLTAIVEALRLGRALGVEPARLRAAVLDGPAASRTLAEMELMRLTWFQKDLANAMTMAAGVHRVLPVAVAVRSAMEHITVGDIAALCADPPT